MKPTGNFEGVRQFNKLVFTLALGIDQMLDCGGLIFISEEINSTDCWFTLSLTSQIQKGFH